MASQSLQDPTSLNQTFQYKTATHSYTVKWCSLGDPASPPLIFIHGTPWSSRLWKPLALALSRKFHVYLYDRPGFGESSPESLLPGQPTSSDPIVQFDGDLARQSEVFAALFQVWKQSWGGQDPHVVAHDNAGLLSLRAYLLHECRYASLCLINVVAIGPFGQSLFKAIAEDPARFEQLPDAAIEGILEGYIRNAAFKELPKDTIQALKSQWLREGGKKGFIRELCQANVRSTDAVEPRYGGVGPDLPVKIIWGANDSWIPAEAAGRLGKALNAKEVVLIEEAGHLSMIDQPEQMGVELGTWLTSLVRT
jgi:pimeloyl-ACP methyl ester carboxylesterase